MKINKFLLFGSKNIKKKMFKIKISVIGPVRVKLILFFKPFNKPVQIYLVIIITIKKIILNYIERKNYNLQLFSRCW